MTTPQTQAEAMVTEIAKKLPLLPIPESLWKEIESGFSTALSKLIAENEGAKCQKCSTPRTRILGTVEYFKCRVCHRDEMLREQMTLIESLQSQLAATQKENERLVNDSRNDCARYDDIAAKLTATEARLSEVTSNGWLKHANNCAVNLDKDRCTCGLSAFLSTLTAEKKEH